MRYKLGRERCAVELRGVGVGVDAQSSGAAFGTLLERDGDGELVVRGVADTSAARPAFPLLREELPPGVARLVCQVHHRDVVHPRRRAVGELPGDGARAAVAVLVLDALPRLVHRVRKLAGALGHPVLLIEQPSSLVRRPLRKCLRFREEPPRLRAALVRRGGSLLVLARRTRPQLFGEKLLGGEAHPDRLVVGKRRARLFEPHRGCHNRVVLARRLVRPSCHLKLERLLDVARCPRGALLVVEVEAPRIVVDPDPPLMPKLVHHLDLAGGPKALLKVLGELARVDHLDHAPLPLLSILPNLLPGLVGLGGERNSLAPTRRPSERDLCRRWRVPPLADVNKHLDLDVLVLRGRTRARDRHVLHCRRVPEVRLLVCDGKRELRLLHVPHALEDLVRKKLILARRARLQRGRMQHVR
mmetsp:Transcript_6784/g.16421  ORF Transcript_6784/g.16421 Transcript_6784/m.16421 type:complete len:415 (-) Transcript_6784:1356-2600(-)